jgi:hypothetical protein
MQAVGGKPPPAPPPPPPEPEVINASPTVISDQDVIELDDPPLSKEEAEQKFWEERAAQRRAAWDKVAKERAASPDPFSKAATALNETFAAHPEIARTEDKVNNELDSFVFGHDTPPDRISITAPVKKHVPKMIETVVELSPMALAVERLRGKKK